MKYNFRKHFLNGVFVYFLFSKFINWAKLKHQEGWFGPTDHMFDCPVLEV